MTIFGGVLGGKADWVWRDMVDVILNKGVPHSPRGMKTLELIGRQQWVNMAHPVVTSKARKLSYRFMAAEAWWILSGRSDAESLAQYSEKAASFSDDGVALFGAYGPKVREQIGYVVDTLVRDRDSRQAVMTIWRERPGKTKDVPCTVALQFLIRDDHLFCVDTMRSSDVWLGWPYDVFSFSMVSAAVCLRLRDMGVDVRLGGLVLQAGSQHLYERDLVKARFARAESIETVAFKYEALHDPARAFDSERELISHLKALADNDAAKLAPSKWLQEMLTIT